MSNEKQLTRNAGRIATGTMVSRVLGYIRDMLVAHTFGAGFAADAFYAAYRIPNLLRRLLGEGSLSASFIPVLSQYLHDDSQEKTQRLINTVFSVLTVVLVVVTAAGVFLSPYLVKVIAYGFTDTPEKFELTVSLTRLMFPFILFICLAALLLGILNTLSAFFIPAVAPASLSVSEIVYLLALAPLLAPGDRIKGLALSVIIGGLGQFAVQLPRLKSLGWKLGWNFDLRHPGLRRVGKLMLPSMAGLSVDQFNAFIDTVCASFLVQGSITALYYSNRVMQLPLAIFGLALASVALPAMSRAAARRDMPQLKSTLNFAVRFIIFILVPAAAGLMILGLPIVSLLFERGRFDRAASLLTDRALFYYSLGLPAYAVVKVLASAFYSMQETGTPVKIAAGAMLLNAVLNVILMRPLGVGGLALATAIASYVNAIALAYVLRKRIGAFGFGRILRTSAKTAASAAAMGFVAYWVAFVLLPSRPAAAVPVAILAGSVSFFALSTALGIEERKPVFSLLTRDKPTTPAP